MTPTITKLLSILLLCLSQRCCAFSPTKHTTQKLHRWHKSSPHPLSPSLHQSNKDTTENKNNDDDEAIQESQRESYTWAELQSDPELSKLERQSSMRRKNVMLLPQRVAAATSVLAWSFVVGGILLNSVGYAWVRDKSGGIGIGTLNERDFQREVVRSRSSLVKPESSPEGSFEYE